MEDNNNNDKDKALLKIKGQVWKAKVSMHFIEDETNAGLSSKKKGWKIKEFLN